MATYYDVPVRLTILADSPEEAERLAEQLLFEAHAPALGSYSVPTS